MQLYLFVKSKDSNIIEKGSSLIEPGIANYYDKNNGYYFYHQGNKSAPQIVITANDLGDYNCEEILTNLKKDINFHGSYDTILSLAALVDDYFIAKTDFWGVFHHYYFYDKDTFICSNNIFAIAEIIDAQISETSLYEYLFFLSPIGRNTWYENIYVLKPETALRFHLKSDSLIISNAINQYEEICKMKTDSKYDVETIFSDFFESAKISLKKGKAIISLSAGSDSRSVLAGLRSKNMLVKAVSFGSRNLYETSFINKMCHDLNIINDVYYFEDLLVNYEELFIGGMARTNGLLNPFRVHYPSFYKSVQGDADAIFEGILGSEFVKGEIALGAMTSIYHRCVIKGERIRDTILRSFNCIENAKKAKMITYIENKYEDCLTPISSQKGKENYMNFALEFIPSRIFSPLITLADENFKTYYPFLSKNILASVFANYGLPHYNTLTNDKLGSIKTLIPQSKMIKNIDKQLYSYKLDRMISLKEAEQLPVYLSKLLRKFYLMRKKIDMMKKIPGQVEIDQLISHSNSFLARHKERWENNYSCIDKLENHKMIKEACTLLFLNYDNKKKIKYLHINSLKIL